MTEDNLPIHDDAEQAVLSACLMATNAYDEAAAIVGEEHFYSGRHAAIWRAMRECRADGVAIEPYGVEESLKRAGELSLAGGKDYLGFILDMVPTAANVGYHAGLVREYHNRRELIRVGEELAAKAREGRETAQVLAASVSSSLVEVAAKSATGGFRHIRRFVPDVMHSIEDRANGKEAPGVATGYREIDEAIGGFRGGDLVIAAGVPGSGKTALALNIAAERRSRGS
jgi:replicative DNA helicase